MESIWYQESNLPEFPTLKGSHSTDVLIIGGGLTGILCAFFLQMEGIDYLLIEADRVCGGVSGNTTAKITFQHGLIYHKLMEKYGAETARLYLEANREALNYYQDLCKNIDCDFETLDNFIYSSFSPAELHQEMEALAAIGFHAAYYETLDLPVPVQGAICFAKQAQFHPLKFCAAILPDLNIYEHTHALAFDETGVVTDEGRIRAEKIIVATHFPIFNKHGLYPLKMYQNRSYIMALDGFPIPKGMYLDTEKDGFSFRRYNGLTLVGGGAHRTGKTSSGWSSIEKLAAKTAPDSCEIARWAAQDCMTLDGIPYVGRYCKSKDRLFIATGFNKWGMTSSMAAAMLLRDLILDRRNPYENLFDPSRTIWHPQLGVNAWEATVNLLTPTKPRCPHLGCALKWNKQERSWDCPCHGSRFSDSGKVLDNPSNGDLK